jgi:hypothetical protein
MADKPLFLTISGMILKNDRITFYAKELQLILFSVFVLFIGLNSYAQKPALTVYIDKEGVMRSSATKQPVAYFGVNYTTPFAFAYRALNTLGVSPEKAIDQDVYHMARLG